MSKGIFSLDVDSIGSVPMRCLEASSDAENKSAAAVTVSYQDLEVGALSLRLSLIVPHLLSINPTLVPCVSETCPSWGIWKMG